MLSRAAPGIDELNGDAGHDTLKGQQGGDIHHGGSGNDTIYGGDTFEIRSTLPSAIGCSATTARTRFTAGAATTISKAAPATTPWKERRETTEASR